MSQLIAIVEDDHATREMIDTLLRDAGYQTVLWPRGKDAHLTIRNARPDLVILDMWMEERDTGRTVLGLMRLDPNTRSIPVIICSAHVQALRARIHQFSEQGYHILEKPFMPEDLLAVIRSTLGPRG